MVRATLIVATLAGAGCIKSGAFACDNNSQCGVGGTCESVGFCSFADGACASGARFGEAAGQFSNQCVGAPTDASVSDDGPPGDGIDPDGSGDGPSAACTDMTVLVGSDDITGGVTDTIPSNIVDAFGYDVTTVAIAKCAWIYVDNIPSGDIRVGVYDHDPSNGGRPSALLASTTIPHPAGGDRWVSGELDTNVALGTGQTRWLAVITTAGSMTMPIKSSCPSGMHPLHNDTQVADLPNPFTVAMTFTSCAAPMFLGP